MFIFMVPWSICFIIMFGTLLHQHNIRVRAEKEAQAEREARATREAENLRKRAAAQAEQERKKAVAQAEQERKKAAADAEKARKKQASDERRAAEHALKVSRAIELAELAERRLQAEKALRELKKAESEQTPSNHFETKSEQAPAPAPRPAPHPLNGKTVSFTGRLTISGMTRSQAIEKVKALGGYAYKDMPASTDILVVGTNPGMQKMDKAAQWISHVKKITESEFLEILAA